MGLRAYLDWNATAPLRAEARAAMLKAYDLTGNPSSVHQEGRAARAAVEQARRDLAALARLLARGGRPLVSVMLANNETGAIQPIAAVAELTHRAGGLLHVDA